MPIKCKHQMTVANISALITRLIFLYLQTKLLNFNGSKDTAKQQMKKTTTINPIAKSKS